MSALTSRSAADLAAALTAGEVSAVEVTTAHLDRIAAVDPAVHAFLHVDAEGALAAAAEVDRRREAGAALHPLAGVPVAVKDVVTTRESRRPPGRGCWRAGSRRTTRRW